jgi:glycosyltransferase involved in cell wall biosynthesis
MRILFVLAGQHLPHMINGETVELHAMCKRLIAARHEPLVVCRGPSDDTAGRDGEASPQFDYTVIRVADPIAAMFEMMGRLAPDATVVLGVDAAARAMAFAGASRKRLHLRFGSVLYGFPAPPPGEPSELRYAVISSYLAGFARAYLGFEPQRLTMLIEPDDYRCERTGNAVLFVNPIAVKGANVVAAIAARLPHRDFLVVPSWVPQRGFPHVPIRLPNVEWAASSLDMRRYYARARLVLMPTIVEEGWGRVVSEAQVSGIPAVASDRGALPEAVGPGGVVLPLAAPVERWCEAVEAMFTDAPRYAALSAAASRHAARPEMAPDQVVARFLRFAES